MKILLTILLNIICGFAFGQSCVDSTLKVTYHSANYKLSIWEKLVDNNDNNTLFGAYQKNISNQNSFWGNFLIKLNQDGSINFAKKINTISTSAGEYQGVIKNLSNGNFLISFGLGTCNNCQSDPISKIALLDNNGNLIWAKRYSTPFGRIGIKLIEEANNGDFILYLSSQEGFEDPGTNYDALMRINALGNIIWSKYFKNNLYNLQTDGESMSVIGNNIYLRGRIIDPFFLFQQLFEHRLSISKISASNGNVVDSKTFLDLKVNDNGGQTFYSRNYTNQINTIDNKILITDRFISESQTKRGSTKAIVDTNLNISGAVFYTKQSGEYYDYRIIGNKNKEIFIHSKNSINNNFHSYVTKIDSNDIPKRELFFNYPTNITNQAMGVKPIGLKDKYINLINSFIQNGNTYIQLVQFPDNVPITACYGRDSNLIQIIPYNITEVHHPFLSQGIDITNITVTDFPVVISPLPLVVQKECEIISNCNLLKINPARDSICNLSNEIQFSTHINGACFKKILWQLDTSAYAYIRAINDTTVAIKFKKTWQGYLYASINPCNNLKDSIYLHVFNTPTFINLGNDTTLCTGASIILNAGVGFKDYTWQDGNINVLRTITTAGNYSVIAHDACGNVFKDTILVKYFIQQPVINFGNDTTLCQNETYTLYAGKGYKTYLWQDGSVADSFKISQSGKYFLKATDSCNNIFNDTINLNYYINRPPVNLGADIIFCAQKTYILNAGLGYKNYIWQDGSIGNSFSANQSGLYFVKVIDSCGNKSSDTLIIKPTENYTLKVGFLPAICLYDTASVLLPNIFSQYSISPSSSFYFHNNIGKFFPDKNTIYDIKALTPAGCTLSDTLLIKVKICPDVIYFPNAFTPNGDFKNEYFLPFSENKPIVYELNIYNRYGQNIFGTKNIKQGWNGKIQSTLQNTGSFVWVCKYQFRNKPSQLKSGTFLLLR